MWAWDDTTHNLHLSVYRTVRVLHYLPPKQSTKHESTIADLYCFTDCTQAAQKILFQSKQQKDTQVRIISPMTPEIDFFKQYLLMLAFLFFFWSYRCRKLDCIRMGSVSKGSIPFLLSWVAEHPLTLQGVIAVPEWQKICSRPLFLALG